LENAGELGEPELEITLSAAAVPGIGLVAARTVFSKRKTLLFPA